MFKTDGGKFPHMNYNRVIKVSRKRLNKDNSPVSILTESDARVIYNITQDMNNISQPELVIKKKGIKKGMI